VQAAYIKDARSLLPVPVSAGKWNEPASPVVLCNGSRANQERRNVSGRSSKDDKTKGAMDKAKGRLKEAAGADEGRDASPGPANRATPI
jgi:hypothetical protein